MNISTVQNSNTNFRCLYKPHKRLTDTDLKNAWLFNEYRDWLSKQPTKKLANIWIAHTKQAINSLLLKVKTGELWVNFFDIEQAKSDISKPFVNLLLNK